MGEHEAQDSRCKGVRTTADIGWTHQQMDAKREVLARLVPPFCRGNEIDHLPRTWHL
jgi:hypothetical protein